MNLEDITDTQTSTKKLRGALRTRNNVKKAVDDLSKKRNPHKGVAPPKQDIDQGLEIDIPSETELSVEDA